MSGRGITAARAQSRQPRADLLSASSIDLTRAPGAARAATSCRRLACRRCVASASMGLGSNKRGPEGTIRPRRGFSRPRERAPSRLPPGAQARAQRGPPGQKPQTPVRHLARGLCRAAGEAGRRVRDLRQAAGENAVRRSLPFDRPDPRLALPQVQFRAGLLRRGSGGAGRGARLSRARRVRARRRGLCGTARAAGARGAARATNTNGRPDGSSHIRLSTCPGCGAARSACGAVHR